MKKKLFTVLACCLFFTVHQSNAQADWDYYTNYIMTKPLKYTDVGVGTKPQTRFHVFSSIGGYPGCGTTFRLEYDQPIINGCTGSALWDMTAYYDASLRFLTPSFTASSVLSLARTGNVGINTDDAQTALHILRNEGSLNLEGIDHTYIQWYPWDYANGRKAWTGFGSRDDIRFTIANEIKGGHIILITDTGNIGLKTSNPMEDVQIGDHFTFRDNGFNSVIARNFYYNGQDRRIVNGKATAIYQDNLGAIRLRTANSGSANSQITWKIGLIVRNDDPQDLPRVGIGTEFPSKRLTVNGDANILGNLDVCGMIGTTEVMVETPWCDYVFDKNHKRMTFEERRSFYPKNKHLPMIEPGWIIERDGLGVASTLKGLTFNMEEFGLNQLDLYDGQETMKQTIKQQQDTIEELKKWLTELEAKLTRMSK